MLGRIVPNPILTLALTAIWLLLLNAFSLGALVLGLIFGILLPLLTRQFWPDAPVLRRPFRIVDYVLVVMWDIVIANVQVAMLILFRPNEKLRPRFFSVPIELTAPEAIAVLAGTITMTPGTVSSDVSADGSCLLVHGLDVADEAETIRTIKHRYERRLKEIFQ